VAILLALFLGGLGLHKFYLGRPGWGVVYLLLCWTGLPSLVAWIEAIGYLTMGDEAWAARHGGPVRRMGRGAQALGWVLALLSVLAAVAVSAVVGLIVLGGQVRRIPSEAGAAIETPAVVSTATPEPSPAPTPTATARATATPVPSGSMDEAEVARLLAAAAADPTDPGPLMALGDLYYFAGDFEVAATWFGEAVEIAPDNAKALLALGACRFNLNQPDEAERLWLMVTVLQPDNAEAYYDLGFLALNREVADYSAVDRYWGKVIALDPGGEMATTVQGHLDSLAAASLIP
jgi:tetratricopeptide (TPR) repeat protein